MKIEKIKPIPKYIEKKIKAIDRTYPVRGRTRFYAYLTKNDGEIVKVTVAVKEKKNKWCCKQVAVHGVHSDKCFVKDMEFTYVGGYIVGWYAEGFGKHKPWYEDGYWGWTDDKLFDPYAPIINREYILEKFPEYKYSAIDRYMGIQLLKYLRLYEKYPQIEYLTKLGLQKIAFSTQILRLCGKDKKFRKWIANNRQDIIQSSYYISSVIKAYKTNGSIKEIDEFERKKKYFDSTQQIGSVKALVKDELEKFFNYVETQEIGFYSYRDYLDACLYLGLDMSEDKNRYPHDFRRWHDIRIDEYHTAKALNDERERKALLDKFATVAEKYIALQYDKKSNFISIIAHSPNDLINEGQALGHCVGRMNYDQKFAREESLIFFIRTKEHPDVPLVTIEYSPARKCILQCYGKGNKTPNCTVLEFINKKWLPFANRQLKKLAA